MNVYLPNKRLPSTYQEVEYIKSSGTQYINTWFIPSNTTKIQVSMWWWTYVQQYAHLFWVRAAWSTTDASVWRWFFLCHQYNSSYIWMFGKWYSSSSGWWSSTTFSFANWNNHIVEMSQSGAYEDGTLKASLQTVTFTSPSNMCIFALNDNGTVKENSSYKLYYFKIRDNWTLVRNFVPCYRKSDNVIWLYDLVNSVFYTNSWTGTFSKGNDVTMAELKNAYIGEYITYTFNFQTDWALDWTDAPLWYWNCSIVSWQWWQITKSSWSQDKQGWIVPPQSVYKWTLKKYKIWFYKNQWAASWIGNSSQNYLIEYGRSNQLIVRSPSASTIATITLTGEILMELIFEDNWHITINLTNNWTTNTYDWWAVASTFQELWTNKNLWIMLWEWVQTQGSSSKVYVRKVEIESA